MIKTKINQRQYLRLSLAAIASGIIMYIVGSCNKETETIVKVSYVTKEPDIISRYKPFTIDNLKELISQLDIRFPDVVLAQAYLESGNFTSHIFTSNNNMFGMKCARKRLSTHKGELNGHAYFNCWEDCVVDYAYFQSTYACHIRNQKDYLEYLDTYYAEDPNYSNKLKEIMHEII